MDDDVFFYVENLLKVFPRHEHFKRISGVVWKNVKPIRKADAGDYHSKWICPYWNVPLP